MLSYELVKSLHISFAFLFIGMAVVSLLASKTKWHGMIMALGSVMTLVMGLFLIGILRSGMNYWMVAKLVIWLALMAVIGMVNKRFPKYKVHAAGLVFLLVTLAVAMAVYKPL